MENETNVERTDSIKVSMNAKGDYSWEIKIYFNSEIEGAQKETLTKISDIDLELKRNYKGTR